MLFPTLAFLIFFLVVYALVWSPWVMRDNEWRKIILLVASWVFYGWWDFRFVALLIASGLINWGAAQVIVRSGERPKRRSWILALGVVLNLGILGWFKYYGFFIENVGALLTSLGWQRDLLVFDVVLPIGVSFFTFQGMSYLIDIYKQKTQPARLLDIILLMSFFPHLIAGPIVRASHLVPQFAEVPKVSRGMAAAGFTLIIWGLFKKAVIASELATRFVDPIFFDPATQTSLDLLLGAYGYAVQIYCDFSAYSDMAIGLAALLGFRFPWNFNQPYRAATLQDFWRRWHISLSSWLRDYLYIGLGGSRHGILRMYFALLMTMLLGGLWHGASWNFIVWGALHGTILVVERLWRDYRPRRWPHLPHAVKVIIIFHVVTLAWIFFRCATFSDSMAYLAGLVAFKSGETLLTPFVLALMVVGLSFHVGPPDMIQRVARMVKRLNWVSAGVLAAIAMLIIDSMRPEGIAKFIYYQF